MVPLVPKVLSKGQIAYAKHQSKSQGSVYTSTTIDVTPEMLPSFRILAYYLLPTGADQNPELVADSLWIDVRDRCMGTVSQFLEVIRHHRQSPLCPFRDFSGGWGRAEKRQVKTWSWDWPGGAPKCSSSTERH